ncbi:hypothetical protein K438DRAFT_1926757 [Mycena galopus ATCC 62051]|nr:hypothetical protein K438DRAFT_1926757 [Mycena galopus ATCC 62051]
MQPAQLRHLLPKPASQSQRDTLFGPQVVVHEDLLGLDISNNGNSLHSGGCGSNRRVEGLKMEPTRRSLGQKRRREREAQENSKPVASESSKSHRSVAQQARRQRELAAVIQKDLSTSSRCHSNRRSEAQKLRRQMEAAHRHLEISPECDSTEALARLLDLDHDPYARVHAESHRDRMCRQLGIEESQ